MAPAKPSPPRDSRDAEARFQLCEFKDPLPGVPSGLLNAEDLIGYAYETGMIYPFIEEPKRIKAASYGVEMGGPCVYWDEKGNQFAMVVTAGNKFILRPNTIAFVTLAPEFRLPSYLALSFNLTIKHIYRGLLLGTGPIVDPGFTGRLSLPLHNLTSNTYSLSASELLVWLNITKLNRPAVDIDKSRPLRFYFNPSRRWTDVYGYLEMADAGESIQSSIPGSLYAARESATEAAKLAKEASTSATATESTAAAQARRVRNVSIAALVGGLFSIALLLFATWQLIFQAQTALNSAQQNSEAVRQLSTSVCQIAARQPGPIPAICATPTPTPPTQVGGSRPAP